MIKLIASDLDGTLLQNGAQNLTPRSIELIEKITEKGIYFVAASGRQYDNETRLFEPIKEKISYIAENGALCIHEKRAISHTYIEPDLLERLLAEIKKDSLFEILLSREDTCFIEDRDPDFIDYIVNVMRNTTQIVEDVRKVEGPFLKLAVCNMKAGSHAIEESLHYFKEKYGSEIKPVTSGNIWIDFLTPGADKGTALQKFLEVLHIRPEECMAFGDQYNDVAMLKTAGISIAMANAAPGISAYATYVTDSVEDVLEALLKKL